MNQDSSLNNAASVRPARRNAVDFHAGGVPTDHWHAGKPEKIVCKQPTGLFALYFHSIPLGTEDVIVGLGMTECEYGGGFTIYMPHSKVRPLLPPELQDSGTEAFLTIEWPGYEHLGYRKKFRLDTAIGDVASQVAIIFREFYNKHSGDFLRPGVPLGPNHVTFEQIRLRNIWYYNYEWHIEASYVHDGTEIYIR
ncbi:hypothetical protein CC1G_02837 [Coprinopsis cinerea okayama7|uniref:Uncharacterized protein n=1 Tax=Coprinopsis cinerea (strain Okayama-7 / 130 / ATCC MYA-4618 / FGSC 9003) TaxID=240176 RepID=A8N068_COPC7|nr:hypothetical protein CC1G_02837 [Coprinopsis cinerea okayama7\|eukprot:XP_001828256.1 hypothetical protein CC1G_02837 [Coprinopsis cinerea okayama7\